MDKWSVRERDAFTGDNNCGGMTDTEVRARVKNGGPSVRWYVGWRGCVGRSIGMYCSFATPDEAVANIREYAARNGLRDTPHIVTDRANELKRFCTPDDHPGLVWFSSAHALKEAYARGTHVQSHCEMEWLATRAFCEHTAARAIEKIAEMKRALVTLSDLPLATEGVFERKETEEEEKEKETKIGAHRHVGSKIARAGAGAKIGAGADVDAKSIRTVKRARA